MSDSLDMINRCGLVPHEADRLLRTVTRASRVELLGGLRVTECQATRFSRLVERRLAGEPLQYLEGSVPFGPIELEVDQRVFIPRPETEQLWERAMELLPAGRGTVVDLGTGSGCLALAIKYARPDMRVVATDISPLALAAARSNAARAGLEVEFREGDGLAALECSLIGAVAMIVTNPPYISEADWPGLPSEVRDHEPRTALVMGDGLAMYRHLASEGRRWLAPAGVLVAEIGETQGDRLSVLFGEQGWDSEVHRDWTGRDRFLVAYPGP